MWQELVAVRRVGIRSPEALLWAGQGMDGFEAGHMGLGEWVELVQSGKLWKLSRAQTKRTQPVQQSKTDEHVGH